MSDIIQIKGNVKFPITLDPGVWIFDDRRIDLNTYFDQGRKEENIEEDYVKKQQINGNGRFRRELYFRLL